MGSARASMTSKRGSTRLMPSSGTHAPRGQADGQLEIDALPIKLSTSPYLGEFRAASHFYAWPTTRPSDCERRVAGISRY
jgi:hypothetical protein